MKIVNHLDIRKVSEGDRDILLEWRNNPLVYKYALNPNPVLIENHNRWFDKILSNKDCFFYMGLLDGHRCGSVRYDIIEKNAVEVSISICPEFWGKGIAFELMKMAELRLKNESSIDTIYATVLPENTASMKLFMKSDFQYDLNKFKKNI